MQRGPAEMRLDQAIELLRNRPGSIERFGPEYVQRARAAAVLSDGVRDGAINTTPLWRTHDAAPRVRYDDENEATGRRLHIHVHGFHDDNGAEIEAGEGGDNGAQRADGKVGATLVQRLPGKGTDYFIANDGDGNACLYRTVSTNNAVDPGAISIKSKTLTGDQHRAVARDTKRSHSLLTSINERNRAFWAGK